MCPAPEVNEGIAVELTTCDTKCASVIVLTNPALSIIVADSKVIAAHLHMDERCFIARELAARQCYWAQCVCTEFERED